MVQLKVATLSNKIASPEGEKNGHEIFFSLYRGEETKINSKISTAKHSIE